MAVAAAMAVKAPLKVRTPFSASGLFDGVLAYAPRGAFSAEAVSV